MTRFRIVIIGIGAVADAIAQSIGDLPSATLAAGSCRTRDKGEKFAARFNCRWYDSTDAMLDREKPDVAIIATPSGNHLEPAENCARRKIHVLCEKPLEITVVRAKQMIETCRREGVTLGAFFPQRFNPLVRAIHDAARDNRFGSLALVSASVPWWREDSYYGPGRWQGTRALDGGGALINQAIHYVDLVQWIAAAAMKDLPPHANPVEEVFAYTAKRAHDPAHVEVEDTAVAVLRFRNGAVGQLLAATSMYPGSLRWLQVGGRDGSIELHEDQLITFRFRAERPDDEQIRQRFAHPTQHAGGSSNPMAFNYTNHRLNLASFLEALEQKRPPAISGEEALKAIQIIEACYESAAGARPIKIA